MTPARALVPALRERAERAEAGYQMPKETIEDLLFRDQHGAPWALVALGGEFSSPTM